MAVGIFIGNTIEYPYRDGKGVDPVKHCLIDYLDSVEPEAIVQIPSSNLYRHFGLASWYARTYSKTRLPFYNAPIGWDYAVFGTKVINDVGIYQSDIFKLPTDVELVVAVGIGRDVMYVNRLCRVFKIPFKEIYVQDVMDVCELDSELRQINIKFPSYIQRVK